jgi:antitoxin component YwqK of YwqJK toxin-antitoxin module
MLKSVAAHTILLVIVLALAAPARAGNAPENGAERTQENVLPKVVAVCGVPLTFGVDGDSLRKNNKDIGHDQTDGVNECNEPLRLLWYACKTDAGKAAVKAAHIAKVTCKGVPGDVGTLALVSGTLTAGRAYEESKPYLRSRKQFESLLKVTLGLGSDDPYQDEAWHALASQPNPVTSTTTYCLVGGEKVTFDENVYDPICRRKEDGQVRCWKDGQVVIDLRIDQGRKTGFLTQKTLRGSRRVAYRDNKQHGEERSFENGKLTSLEFFDNGDRVWRKEFRPDGRVASYTHKYPGGSADLTTKEDGHVTRLQCVPAAKDDPEVRKPCGFDGPATTSIYDGTGKVSRVLTFKDGVLQKEGAGTSSYAARSEVAFKDGKKQGEERVLRADGKLSSTIAWDKGVKEGKETTYADDGKKIVKEIVWKAGEMVQVQEWYLNGNLKLEESYRGSKKKRVKEYWDSGKAELEGDVVLCETNDWGFVFRDWCEEGVQKSYFENGKPESEASFHLGKQQGPSKTWWENGKPASVEEWADGRPTKAKRWDKDGKLISDDEFEADGSRKTKR